MTLILTINRLGFLYPKEANFLVMFVHWNSSSEKQYFPEILHISSVERKSNILLFFFFSVVFRVAKSLISR